jgi:hypothetical protein
MTLLGKWLLKLLTEEGIWQTLLRRKYSAISSYFETWRFPFLGGSYGDEVLLPIWIFLH